LRFATTSNEVCAYDLTDAEAFVNGDSSVINILGCMDNLGISSANYTSPIRVYPNPFSNYLVIDNPNELFFQVLDSTGRLIFGDFFNTTLNTNNWAQGTYFIRVFTPFGIKGFSVTKY
jgi:hypothetical protein